MQAVFNRLLYRRSLFPLSLVLLLAAGSGLAYRQYRDTEAVLLKEALQKTR